MQSLPRGEFSHGWTLQALCGVGEGQVLVWAKGPQEWRAEVGPKPHSSPHPEPRATREAS